MFHRRFEEKANCCGGKKSVERFLKMPFIDKLLSLIGIRMIFVSEILPLSFILRYISSASKMHL